jgi:hypothetical protein
MKRISLVATLLAAVLATACSPRFTLFTTWTIDGNSVAVTDDTDGACAPLDAPKVQFRVEGADVKGGTITEETATAPCKDGAASLEVSSFSDVYVDLVDGDNVFGGAGPIAVSPAAADTYEGDSAENPLAIDVGVQRGLLTANLTVVGESCADAGANEFTVTLKRNTGPLGREIIEEGKTVSCVDGQAIYRPEAPVEVGSLYEIVATTKIGGVDYSTGDGTEGGGATIEGLTTSVTVDLDIVGE